MLAKKYTIIYTIISALVLTLAACSDKDDKPKQEVAKPVKAILIGKPDSTQYREFPGKVEAAKTVELSFQVPGKLQKFPVTKGQDIDEGHLIAALDPTDFILKVDETRAMRDERRMAYDRAQGLLPDGYISQSDYDKIKAQYEVTTSTLKQAEQNLIYTKIYAPFTGRISDTYPDNFQYVQAKQPIVLLQDTNDLDIAIDIPESLMINIQGTDVTKRVAVFEAAPGKEYDVEYKKHRLEADEATQTYRVYMTLVNPDELSVLPGMTATVKFEFTEGSSKYTDAYLIPSASVFADEHGKQFVWSVNNKTKRVHAISVEAGELLDGQIRITKGLKPGDVIVTAGVHFLVEDQLVDDQMLDTKD